MLKLVMETVCSSHSINESIFKKKKKPKNKKTKKTRGPGATLLT
jgi:hypothetical protein